MTYVSIHMYMCSREICTCVAGRYVAMLMKMKMSNWHFYGFPSVTVAVFTCFVMYRSTRRGGCLAYNSHVQEF